MSRLSLFLMVATLYLISCNFEKATRRKNTDNSSVENLTSSADSGVTCLDGYSNAKIGYRTPCRCTCPDKSPVTCYFKDGMICGTTETLAKCDGYSTPVTCQDPTGN